MLLADTKNDAESTPIDPFKTIHCQQTKHTSIADKINSVTYMAPTDHAHEEGLGVKQSHNYKWTTIENQFCRKKNRLFDDLPKAEPTR
jgi:hypothetical protein